MVKWLALMLLLAAPAAADFRVTRSYGDTAHVFCDDGRSGVFRNGRGELADPFTPFYEAPSARMRSGARGSTIEVDPLLFPSKRHDAPLGESLKIR